MSPTVAFNFLTFLILIFQESPNSNFQKLRWGMSPAEVKSVEAGKPKSFKKNGIQYQLSIFPNEVGIIDYQFDGNGLEQIVMKFTGSYKTDSDAFDHFNKIVNALSEIYDIPDSSINKHNKSFTREGLNASASWLISNGTITAALYRQDRSTYTEVKINGLRR